MFRRDERPAWSCERFHNTGPPYRKSEKSDALSWQFSGFGPLPCGERVKAMLGKKGP